MKPKTLIYGLVILAAVIAWAAFRPERLFVNAKANEGFPTSAASTVTERILASGTFHSVAHDGSEMPASTSFRTANAFSALQTLRPPTVLMCMFTWSRLTTPLTARW